MAPPMDSIMVHQLWVAQIFVRPSHQGHKGHGRALVIRKSTGHSESERAQLPASTSWLKLASPHGQIDDPATPQPSLHAVSQRAAPKPLLGLLGGTRLAPKPPFPAKGALIRVR
jgi:hypothetical protein